MQLNSDFYKRRLQDRLAVRAIDEWGDVPVQPLTAPIIIASLDELLAIADDADFVRQAYLYFLKREPDFEGLEHFSNAILSRGRESVVDELRDSAEARRVAGTTIDVAAPTVNLAAEREEDRRILASSRPLELAGLLTIAGDEAFVCALYEEILRRPVDHEGLAHHLGQLSAGATRESLTLALGASPEARQAGRPLTWRGQAWPPAPRVSPVRRAIRRLVIGENAPPAVAATPHDDRVTDRVFHHLAEQRETLAGVVRMVSGLQRAVDELRSQAAVPAQSDALPAPLRALGQRQDEMARMLASLATDLKQELRRIQTDNIVASEVGGFIVGVPGEEWRIAAYHKFRGVLEPGLTRRFAESLASGMTVVDIGANIGMYTLIAARAVAPDGRVYSFEPTPRTFAVLKDNVQVNGLIETGIVDFRRVAVTDRRGTARLAVYRNNAGHNTLFAAGSASEAVDVDTVALDDALAGVPRIDVIKIDAEGAEPLIWDGMQQILGRNPAMVVFMEFAPPHLRRAGQDPGAFLDRVTGAGFRIQRVHDATGDLMDQTREELCAEQSVNVMVTRAPA